MRLNTKKPTTKQVQALRKFLADFDAWIESETSGPYPDTMERLLAHGCPTGMHASSLYGLLARGLLVVASVEHYRHDVRGRFGHGIAYSVELPGVGYIPGPDARRVCEEG